MVKNNEYYLEEISKALFEMLCFEEYLEKIDNENIDKLLELCEKLDNFYKSSFYGNIAKNKLLTKKKNCMIISRDLEKHLMTSSLSS